MTDASVLELCQRGMTVALMVSAPMLGFALIVGLLISVFQAATQIQEMTLTFVPKIVAVAAAALVFGPWMLSKLTTFTTSLLSNIPNLVR